MIYKTVGLYFIISSNFTFAFTLKSITTKNQCREEIFNILQNDTGLTLISVESNAYNAWDKIDFLPEASKHVLINDITTISSLTSIYIKNIVIVSAKVSTVHTFFENWKNSMHFHSDSKYFIFYEGPKSKLSEIGNATWIVHAYRVIIIDKDSNLHVLKEYSSQRCKLTEIETLPYDMFKITNILEKQYINFHKCPFVILGRKGVAPYIIDLNSRTNRGWEPLILENVAEKHNFTLKYIYQNMSNTLAFNHGKISCCLYSTVWEGQADILIGLIYATEEVLHYFDVTMIYLPDKLNFVVSKAQKLPAWMNIVYIFTWDTWLYFLGAVALITVLANVLLKIEHTYFNRMLETTEIDLTFNIFAIPLTEAIQFPKEWLLRCVLLSWVAFAFIFSSLFGSTFMSHLVHPVYEKQINSRKDIIQSDYTIYGTFEVSYVLYYDGDPINMEIKKRLELVTQDNMMSAIQKVIDTRRAITTITSTRLEYAIATGRLFVNKDGSAQLHTFEPFLTFNIWMVMQRGLPLQSLINRYLQDIHESGLIHYYTRNTTVFKLKQFKRGNHMPIGISHISLAFFLNMCGLTIAGIVLIVEMLFIKLGFLTRTL